MAENLFDESNRIVALSTGDYDAFNSLYERYHRALYFFALKLSNNPHDAEELTQSVFVTIWETRKSIDPSQSFSTYIFSIARNRFYDMVRKRVTENCYADYILQQNNLLADDLEKQMEDKEINEIIQKLLQQVPERRQEIFRMRHEENLSYKQIAKKLQISENTVDTQIRNVLNFLRKELPKYLKLLLI
jgi:RNA polymerase sigma-70 factor (ECF subfamily)